MANFIFSIPVMDGDNQNSVYSGYIVAADIATLQTRLVALANLVDPLILGAQTPLANVIQTVDLSAATLRTTPLQGADREIKGKFTYATAGGYKKVISLPTFNRTNTVTGGDIDVTVQDVIDFNTEILSNGYSDNRFADLTTLVKAVEAFD